MRPASGVSTLVATEQRETAVDTMREPRHFETISEAAARLGVSTKTLRRRIADGSLMAYRVGSTSLIRLDPDEVEGLLRQIPTVKSA